MPRAINLGNGQVLVGLDKKGLLKDLYFHYAGLENHVGEYFVHKIGVYIEDKFSWLDDGSWDTSVKSEPDSMVSDILAKNSSLGLALHFTDVVYNEKNIFVREVTVRNLFDRGRRVKVYFNQQFNISQTHIGDTAYYDPRASAIIHYKGRRVFLINATNDGEGFSEYSVGLLGIEGKSGTYKDAEDGKLAANPIEHGQVDSVIALEIEVEPNAEKVFHYFIAIAKSIKKVHALNDYVLERKPGDFIKTTRDYWKAWINNQKFSFYGLEQPAIDLFNRSLIIIRTHVNENGSIIASADSSMFQFGRDTYSYVWPRDAAFSAIALAKAGDFNASKRIFEFCNDTITGDGYFMHKYRPDKSLGSSWHPWVQGDKEQLPIQEDGTALVIYALWNYFELSKDLEFIEKIYNSLIKRAADFMAEYRDKDSGLPLPSYDLWERIYGTTTFTSCTVYGALMVASQFAKLLGKEKGSQEYQKTANEIKEGIMKHLYSQEEGIFYKLLNAKEGEIVVDKTIDFSSIFGVYKFELLPKGDPKVKRAIEKTLERLEIKTEVGGIARFEGDSYHNPGGNIPGNPWIVTSMWLTQYYVMLAEKEADMDPVKKWLSWAVSHALPSGVLSEQLHAYSGEQLSAAPLIWSHAEYVITLVDYLYKLEELGVCEACYPVD